MAVNESPLILVVEDDPTIAQAIAARLENDGYQQAVATDGPDAVEKFCKLVPALVILDLNLPGFDGLEVCRQIRTHRWVPIIMLSARDEEEDMLLGLNLGADDYIAKPFSSRELVTRVKAVLRRANTNHKVDLVFGDLRIEPSTRKVFERNQELALTATEFDLLQALCEARGTVLTRDQLLATVWGYRDGSGLRTVDSHIRSLRSKMRNEYIRTVHRVGYAIQLGEAS